MGNKFPDAYGITTLERFSSTKGHTRVKQFHTFGLPCVILDHKLCQNKSIPKWTHQWIQAVSIGISLHHAGSVAMALNLKTGYISPQLHIVFDENFTTTSASITHKILDNWGIFFKNHCELTPE